MMHPKLRQVWNRLCDLKEQFNRVPQHQLSDLIIVEAKIEATLKKLVLDAERAVIIIPTAQIGVHNLTENAKGFSFLLDGPKDERPGIDEAQMSADLKSSAKELSALNETWSDTEADGLVELEDGPKVHKVQATGTTEIKLIGLENIPGLVIRVRENGVEIDASSVLPNRAP